MLYTEVEAKEMAHKKALIKQEADRRICHIRREVEAAQEAKKLRRGLCLR